MVFSKEMVQQLFANKVEQRNKEIRKLINRHKMELYMMENELMCQLCGDMSVSEYESYLYTYMIIRKEIINIFSECIDNSCEQSNILLRNRLHNISIDFNEVELNSITKYIFSLAPVATTGEIRLFFNRIMDGDLKFLREYKIYNNFAIKEYINHSYNHTIE